MSTSRLPVDFVCIGAQKAGTSWLNINLKAHPHAFVPYLKETFYLNLVEHGPHNYPVPREAINAWFREDFRAKTERHIRECVRDSIDGQPEVSRGTATYLGYLCDCLEFYWSGTGRDWYEQLYKIAQPGQLRIDITPDYSLLNDASLDALAASNPDLKVLLLMRDPVARDLSQLKMELLAITPDPCVDKCINFLEQPCVTMRSDYAQILRRWRSRFGANVLAENYDAIAADPGGLMDRVCAFAGLPPLLDRSRLQFLDNVSTSRWKPPAEVVDFLRKRYRA